MQLFRGLMHQKQQAGSMEDTATLRIRHVIPRELAQCHVLNGLPEDYVTARRPRIDPHWDGT